MDHELLRAAFNYDPTTGVFTRKKKWGSKSVGSVVGGLSRAGYVQINFNGRTHTAQRLAWLYVHGRWPAGVIDHINRNRADNRVKNLRDVSSSKNAHNSDARQNSQSNVKGVSLRSLRNGRRPKKAWRADIMVNGTRKFLGNFYTVEDAAAARANAEREFE
jgi:hypothetical protein